MAAISFLVVFSTLPFEIGLFTELGAAVLARQDGCRAMGVSLSLSHSPGITGTCYYAFLLYEYYDLNLGSHSCASTEPYAQL